MSYKLVFWIVVALTLIAAIVADLVGVPRIVTGVCGVVIIGFAHFLTSPRYWTERPGYIPEEPIG